MARLPMPTGMPCVWFIVAGVLVAGLSAAAQQPTFRAGTRTVPLYVTVTDNGNRLVTDLPRDAFEILDNGQRQEITVFETEVRPIAVVVRLDTSISMTLRLDGLFAGAEQFLLRLLPHDRATVGAFNGKIQFATDFTNDRDDLVRSLKELYYGNATRLYDALYASLDRFQDVDESCSSPTARTLAASRGPETRSSAPETKTS
jgi:VWFA-related protein